MSDVFDSKNLSLIFDGAPFELLNAPLGFSEPLFLEFQEELEFAVCRAMANWIVDIKRSHQLFIDCEAASIAFGALLKRPSKGFRRHVRRAKAAEQIAKLANRKSPSG